VENIWNQWFAAAFAASSSIHGAYWQSIEKKAANFARIHFLALLHFQSLYIYCN
jgi:hypothetical protein